MSLYETRVGNFLIFFIRPCMLIPVFGELIASLGLILNTYYAHWPMEVAGITEALFPGLAGGWFTMLMVSFYKKILQGLKTLKSRHKMLSALDKFKAMSIFSINFYFFLKGVFSYIADITTEEERTLRIGIVNLCFSLGVPIGMAFSGVLLK